MTIMEQIAETKMRMVRTVVWTQGKNGFRNIFLEPSLFTVGRISIVLETNLLQPLISQV